MCLDRSEESVHVVTSQSADFLRGLFEHTLYERLRKQKRQNYIFLPPAKLIECLPILLLANSVRNVRYTTCISDAMVLETWFM